MTDQNDNTRQRILNAAIHIFASKGYHDTRVDEIVSASQTSKGAVYFHFPSKQEIFLGLVDEFWPRAAEAVNRNTTLPAIDSRSNHTTGK